MDFETPEKQLSQRRMSTPTIRLKQYKHRSSNDKESQFKCRLCHRVYRHERSLGRHVKETHPEGSRVKKSHPERSHVKKSHLKRNHVKKNHPGKLLKCELCSAAFSAAKGLRRHTNEVHNTVKLYPCDVCNKLFKQKYNVRRHMKQIHKVVENTSDSIVSLPEHECPTRPKQVPDDEPSVTHKFARENKGFCTFL